jgi:hypothetical protein
MPTLTQMPASVMADPRWRAALIVLCEQFGRDPSVWQAVDVGVAIDWRKLLDDPDRTAGERALLGFAAGLVADDAPGVDVAALVELEDRKLRSLLDALAVARGRMLPVWDDEDRWPTRRRRAG